MNIEWNSEENKGSILVLGMLRIFTMNIQR